MSSYTSSRRSTTPSDTSRATSPGSKEESRNDEISESQAPRPTQQDYQTYTALVQNIDKADCLIAKRIIANHDDSSKTVENGNEVNEKRNGQDLSSLWPLQQTESHLVNPDSLEESILAFASAYIRQNNLVLHRRQALQLSATPDTGLEDLDEIIPDFLPGMMETVDRLLDNLAVMRPAASRKKRAELRSMNWNSVLYAGMIGDSLDGSVLLEANRKIRDLLSVTGQDVLASRLEVLHSHIAPEEDAAEDQPIPRTRQRDIHRPHHLSAEELERRAVKKEQKAAKKLELAQAKATQSTKSAKRQRQHEKQA